MKIIIKKPTTATREEINIFYNFLGNLSLQQNHDRIKKIKKCVLIGFCKNKKQKIIGISAIKKPSDNRIKKINKDIKIKLNTNIKEYGYVYITPKYRGLSISKKIYKKLSKKLKDPIYSITKSDNFAMKNLFKQFEFINKGSFPSTLDGKLLDFYIKS